jgi:type III restriction enzyme
MINLFQFQRAASTQIADRFMEYYGNEVLKGTAKHPVKVPFFQALAAITGAGKTAVLADSVSQIAATLPVAPVVLWLSKGKVVVQQSYANLAPGGKYNHLLGSALVRPLGEYDSEEVEHADIPLVFFATVGTFNQKDMEAGTLTIFRSEVDTTGQPTWDALAERKDFQGRRRPLLIVYDEGQNLSDQQTDLLLRQEPDAFLVASATMRLPDLLAAEIERLKHEHTQNWLVTVARSSAVVSEGLIKSELALAGYKAPMEETIAALLEDMRQAEADAKDYGIDVHPKAIYVCKTNVLADDADRRDDPRQPFGQREAPPIMIWRYLVDQCGVDPSEIAVYANLDTHKDYPLPQEFVLFNRGDKDYDDFTGGDFRHIIFNLTLQEGWDDPNVYFAYVDKSMESSVQITQVIGRVLRQPGAEHYPPARLNTAHFYVRVDKSETFTEVLKEVGKHLGTDAPEVKIVASPPGPDRPRQIEVKEHREIPKTGLDGREAVAPVEQLLGRMIDYNDSDANTTGVGSRKVVHQQVGAHADESTDWEQYEQSSKVAARWIFHREIRRLYANALNVASTADRRFDAKIGIGSPAFSQIVDLARQVVHAYIENVTLVQAKPNPYRVGPIVARDTDIERFSNALHEGYDGLNILESRFAHALDSAGVPWFRNPPQSGYGVPLVDIGDTGRFFPDFIFWTDNAVVCIDTKGAHILHGEAGRKLLAIAPNKSSTNRLEVRFVSAGEWDGEMQKLSPDGYTIWGLRANGKRRAQHYPSLEETVAALVAIGSRQ